MSAFDASPGSLRLLGIVRGVAPRSIGSMAGAGTKDDGGAVGGGAVGPGANSWGRRPIIPRHGRPLQRLYASNTIYNQLVQRRLRLMRIFITAG